MQREAVWLMCRINTLGARDSERLCRLGAHLGLTSAPRPLLAYAPSPVRLALHQPAALQVMPRTAAQHHLSAILVQGPRDQPPGDVLGELGLDARAGDRWKRNRLNVIIFSP